MEGIIPSHIWWSKTINLTNTQDSIFYTNLSLLTRKHLHRSDQILPPIFATLLFFFLGMIFQGFSMFGTFYGLFIVSASKVKMQLFIICKIFTWLKIKNRWVSNYVALIVKYFKLCTMLTISSRRGWNNMMYIWYSITTLFAVRKF